MQQRSIRQRLQSIQVRWPFLAIIVVLILVLFFMAMDHTRRNLYNAEQALIMSERERSEIGMTLVDKQQRVDNLGTRQDTTNRAQQQGMIMEGELCFEVTNPDRLDAYTEEEYRILMQERAWDQ